MAAPLPSGAADRTKLERDATAVMAKLYLRIKGKTVAYYNTSGVSYGLQAGAQKYGYALFIMSDSGLKAIEQAEGFEVGVGPSVVVMDDAMAKKTSTTTINKDIYAYIFSQKGLMAGLGIQGNKLTRIDK